MSEPDEHGVIEKDGMTILPCGCQFTTVQDAFVFEPCALDCQYYEYVKEESARQDKDLTELDLR